MEREELKKIIKQVIYNPQVLRPPITYRITDVDNTGRIKGYTSNYIDEGDFDGYLERLEAQLIYRLATKDVPPK